MKYYITGTRRGLGYELSKILPTVDTLEECDVFINCKHDSFSQVELLFEAAGLGKRIINIGSNAPDELKKSLPHAAYAVQKSALDYANHQLFYHGVNTTILRFGYFDSERVAHVNAAKMELSYVVDTVLWVLEQPHRVKELTITPRKNDK